MKRIESYISEKLKINSKTVAEKHKLNLIPCEEKYEVGDVCLCLSLETSENDGDFIYPKFFKIREIDWKNQKLSLTNIMMSKYDVERKRDFNYYNHSYKYKMKSTKGTSFISLAKTYGVETDTILISEEESVDILETIINTGKLNMSSFIPKMKDEYLQVGVWGARLGNCEVLEKSVYEYYIDLLKKHIASRSK